MSSHVDAYRCFSHPDVPTSQVCAACGRPFCENCLVEVQGRQVCAYCKFASISGMQQPQTVDARKVVAWARVYDIAMMAAAVVLLVLNAAFVLFLSDRATFQGAQLFSSDPAELVLPAVFAVGALVLALPPAIGLGPGRKWAYGWQALALAGGAALFWYWMNCLALPLIAGAGTLLFYWIRPEVWRYFEKEA